MPSGSRRAPHGARGLKLCAREERRVVLSRAPHGARGLKLLARHHRPGLVEVAPRMGRVD